MQEDIALASRLASLIKIKTVSTFEQKNVENYSIFIEQIKSLFPDLIRISKLVQFDQGFYFLYPGTGKENILFMNHHDVVAADGSWKFDPYSGYIDNNKIYGRGTLDTKGGLFCMLEAANKLAKENFKPKHNIYLLSTSNEETSGSGADYISSFFLSNNIHFKYVIDEGGMIMHDPIGFADGDFAMVGVGEKPVASIKFSIVNKEAIHASTPGDNTPLARLSKFIVDVNSPHSFSRKVSKTHHKMFSCFSLKMKGVLAFICKHSRFFSILIKNVFPRFSNSAKAMFQTTVAFTVIKGSETYNSLPIEAYVIGNVRYAHHQSITYVNNILNKYAKKHGLKMEIVDEGFPSNVSSYETIEYKNIENAINEIYPDVIVTPFITNTASDARYFSKVSENIFRFVPFFISDEQFDSIHGDNENLDIINLSRAVNFYSILMKGDNE